MRDSVAQANIRAALCLLLASTTACTELLGVDDLPYDDGGAGGRGGGSSGEPQASASGSVASGGAADGCGTMADCDGDRICETEVLTDPENCGACGRGCEIVALSSDVACNEGNCELTCNPGYYQCQANCIPEGDNCQKFEEQPVALALDDAHVYVALAGPRQTLVRYDRDLSNRQELAIETVAVNRGTLVVHAGNLYWASPAGVRQMPVQGGAVDTIHAADAGSVRARGPYVYWSDMQTGAIWRAPVSAGEPEQVTEVTPADGIVDFAVSDIEIFYGTESGDVWVVPNGGGQPSLLARGVSPDKMVVAAAIPVFWAQSSGLVQFDYFDIYPVVENPSLSGGVSLALGDSSLYYASNALEEVVRVSYSGDFPATIALAQYAPDNVAVGFGAVYWTRPEAVVRTADP